MDLHNIQLEERGHTDIAHSTWTALSQEPTFRHLLAGGILSATFLPAGVTRLHASCYVGRTQCGHIQIEIQEKVPGALEALISYATSAAFRIEHANSPASDFGLLISLLIRQLLLAVTAYASRSRSFEYRRKEMVGSLIGGRIDVVKSARLRARGQTHLVAFDKSAIAFDTPLNRVVLAALMEVEQIAHLVRIQPEDTSKARGLSLLFSDCRDPDIMFGGRSVLARLASDLASGQLVGQQRDVAALASVILARESFESSTWTGSLAPRSWFLNLENLFEQAVLSVLREIVSSGTHVYRGIDNPQPIFHHESGTHRGHPDLVVVRQDGRVTVGDVKYKNWSGDAVASDLYQLLVHTSAFAGTTSFLVFPNCDYQSKSLGAAVTGPDAWLFALDVKNLTDSVTRMAEELGATAAGTILPAAQTSAGRAL